MLGKKLFFLIFLFVLVGEMMVRFDEEFKLLESTQVVKISTDLTITPEFTLLKKSAINFNGNNLRVMVLGDSFIHGGGIEFKDNFSQQLKKLLQQSNQHYDDIYVLDLSKASANNFDNNQIYFQFVDKFKPDIVILGYSYSASRGDLYKHNAIVGMDSFVNINYSAVKKQSIPQKIYSVIYHSSVLHYILYNFHNYLKSYGVVFPNSEFNLILNDYTENMENWKRSKYLLSQINNDVIKRNIQLIVLKFPEMNLIGYPKIFIGADNVIKAFYDQSPAVTYINSIDFFNRESSKDYILSKYDGHPNERAHKKIAQQIFNIIKRTPSIHF
jgi:hypothetical protein